MPPSIASFSLLGLLDRKVYVLESDEAAQERLGSQPTPALAYAGLGNFILSAHEWRKYLSY
jgi:hypothetical protein